MAGGITVEQMEFLEARGLSLSEVIAFAKMSEKPRSKGAERIARWRARKSGNVTGNVTGNALPPPIEDHTPPVSSSDETKPAPKAPGIAKPDGVKDQTWIDFQRVRKAKKAPLTQTAMAGIEREATAAGWSMESALAECVTRNWQAFKAEWVAGKPTAANDGSYLDHLSKSRAQGP